MHSHFAKHPALDIQPEGMNRVQALEGASLLGPAGQTLHSHDKERQFYPSLVIDRGLSHESQIEKPMGDKYSRTGAGFLMLQFYPRTKWIAKTDLFLLL